MKETCHYVFILLVIYNCSLSCNLSIFKHFYQSWILINKLGSFTLYTYYKCGLYAYLVSIRIYTLCRLLYSFGLVQQNILDLYSWCCCPGNPVVTRGLNGCRLWVTQKEICVIQYICPIYEREEKAMVSHYVDHGFLRFLRLGHPKTFTLVH